MNCDVISLSKFLSRYAGVMGYDLNHLKHNDVQILFPFLQRATFDEVREDYELVLSGKIALVSDGKKTIPYYVPELSISDGFDKTEVIREDVERFVVDDEYYNYELLSEYELRQLLRRKYNSQRNQREARKELETRGLILKKGNKKYRY